MVQFNIRNENESTHNQERVMIPCWRMWWSRHSLRAAAFLAYSKGWQRHEL